MRNRPPTSPFAFTLVELVTVVAIIGTLSAIAIPRYSASIQNFKTASGARRLAADLAMAQSRARAASQGLTLTFFPAASSYTISNIKGMDGANTYTVNLTHPPYQCRISKATFPGGVSEIKFDGYGNASGNAEIIVSAGSLYRTVSLDARSGQIAVR